MINISTTITSRDRLIDILSLSYLGDLLREKLGEDVENYVFPDDFEKAVANIGFSALSAVGEYPNYDKLICIGNGLSLLPRANPNSDTRTSYKTVQFIAPTMTEIPYYGFARMATLESVVIPDCVTKIDHYAFQNCTGLKDVVIPDSVTSIGYGCFVGCNDLEHVRLPKSFICGNAPFNACSFSATAGIENSEDNYNIEFADGTTNIPIALFQNYYGLTACVIPDGVTSIGQNAFASCTSLTEIDIPDSVTTIGNSVFNGCSALSGTVNLDGVTDKATGNIAGLFANCTSLEHISMKHIQRLTNGSNNNYGAFSNCSGLKTCQLGSVGYPITEISNNVFYGCNNTALVITAYTDSSHVDTILANIRNTAVNATIIIKASSDLEYNGTSYSAGATVVTSTP